ncbi:MAG: biotin--[acetyl-CoA-carboxylase] ligase [Chloroflexi bacterium]|nr:biotin--[acetyl-CoA-carboxylase] ligase [Chloroflexota bacterium]
MTAPFNLARFHSLLKTRAFGRNFIFEPSVGSTMDVARDAALRGAAEGTVAAADEQTSGRGRLGRTWVTPPAVNLASTLVLRPPHSVLRDIAMMTPLAICHAIQEVAGVRPDIKWPNDVQIGGKKVAGILIESDLSDERRQFVLIGAGINVNFDPREYEEIRDIATSLRVETGRDADREALLASYLAHFERLYEEAKAGESIRDRWRERLITIGQQVRAVWPGGSAEGLAEDVDSSGALLVRQADGTAVTVEAGDVTLRA